MKKEEANLFPLLLYYLLNFFENSRLKHPSHSFFAFHLLHHFF